MLFTECLLLNTSLNLIWAGLFTYLYNMEIDKCLHCPIWSFKQGSPNQDTCTPCWDYAFAWITPSPAVVSKTCCQKRSVRLAPGASFRSLRFLVSKLVNEGFTRDDSSSLYGLRGDSSSTHTHESGDPAYSKFFFLGRGSNQGAHTPDAFMASVASVTWAMDTCTWTLLACYLVSRWVISS